MADSMQQVRDESWAYALALYARPGVPGACLALQEAAGVDIPLLLVASFALTRRRIVLAAADIEKMDTISRPWRETVVHPLRTMRISLKSGPAPAPCAATEDLRTQIKAAELEAERLQNDILVDWLVTREPGDHLPTPDERRELLLDLVAVFSRSSGRTAASLHAQIEIILAAMAL